MSSHKFDMKSYVVAGDMMPHQIPETIVLRLFHRSFSREEFRVQSLRFLGIKRLQRLWDGCVGHKGSFEQVSHSFASSYRYKYIPMKQTKMTSVLGYDYNCL